MTRKLPLTFKIFSLAGIISVLLFSGFYSTNTYAQPEKAWVVVLKDPRPARLQGWQRSNYLTGGNYNDSLELKKLGQRISKDFNLELKQQWFIESLKVYCLIVHFNEDEQQTINNLQQDQRIKWVQPSNNFNLLGEAPSIDSPTEPVNYIDTLSQYTLPDHLNGKGVKIAIIDSAVDTMHKDLTSSIYRNNDFVIADTADSKNGESHGTAIAGILVANTNNELGIAGLSPAAQLYAYRGCWEETSGNTRCNTLSLARALDAVAQTTPDILNLSLSGPKDRLLDQLVKQVTSNGTLIIAAFDSSRENTQRFPSKDRHILFVRAEELNTQSDQVFTAPGSRIVLAPNNRYKLATGHSIATAYTSGVVALYRQSMQENKRETNWDAIINLASSEELIHQLLNAQVTPLTQ